MAAELFEWLWWRFECYAFGYNEVTPLEETKELYGG
jgi:hypothetical protein